MPKITKLMLNGQEYGFKSAEPPVPLPERLCFTANTAGSTVALNKNGSPTTVTLETSTDGSTWSTYTFGNTITLSNIGDKVYFRNTSETDTGFSTSTSNYYQFSMSGSISASGDVNYLLNKNSTDTFSYAQDYCYFRLFYMCGDLNTAPKLPSTSIMSNCYREMFSGCGTLTILPRLPALTLYTGCYFQMFRYCYSIKLSTTQTGEYQTEYRIPYEGTGIDDSGTLSSMFANTGGTFTGTPSINTTYYTSNTVV